MANVTQPPKRFVAYFSMEIALKNQIPTYSVGLGVLAGDTHSRRGRYPVAHGCRLAAPIAKAISGSGFPKRSAQTEEEVEWDVAEHLIEEEPHVSITLEGRKVETGVRGGIARRGVRGVRRSRFISWMRICRGMMCETAS